METVYSRFKEISQKYKDNTAVIENERKLTFGTLSDMIDKICAAFPDGEFKNVGIVTSHNAEMIASMFAVLKCGGCYVPAEPSFPRGRIEEMFSEAEVDFVITEKAFADKLDGYPLFLVDDIKPSGIKNKNCEYAAVSPDTPAYILYTSGTTGRPKGVCVTNGNVLYYARAFANEFKPGPGDVMLQYSVCTFDIFVEEVFATLLNGAAIAIPNETQKDDIELLINFIDANKITLISGFPYLFEEINKNGVFPASLRLFLSGGDVLRASYIEDVPARIEVYNTYGPSETTVCSSYYNCRGGEILEDGTYPIGKAVLGAEMIILGKDGKPVKKGDTGEIAILGGGVSLGYIGNHEEENRAFVTLDNGKRIYKSGDLGYELENGDFVFLHRKDSQVMIKGRRVETAEVQSRLYEIDGVEQAFVQAFSDEWGLSYMTAYIVLSDGSIKLSEIRRDLSDKLPNYMIPDFFVKMDEIPKNENGKPDVGKLPVVMK